MQKRLTGTLTHAKLKRASAERRNRSQRLLRQVFQAMKIKYFQDTDTLYIEFKTVEVAETRDLDENTLLDIDRDGKICGITIEHASDRADIPAFSFEQVSA